MDSLQHTIKSCIKGDEKAQRKLYDLHKTRWYMISMRYGKTIMQAEDIFQEGLIRIYNNLEKFDPAKSGFPTWSSKVLVNAALRYLEKYNWANAFSDIKDGMHISDTNTTVIEQMTAKEMTLLVQQLPLGYRLVFNMFAIEGYSHKEIAKELGISEGTSKSQLYKARRELKLKLESHLETRHYE